ncbi:MAG: murein hydrolase activator EnvC family protein [Actinomycetota bacterium]
MRLRRLVLPLAMTTLVLVPANVRVASAWGSWPWPVVGPVVRAFDPPSTPFGAGHRGIDIAVPYGTSIAAPAPGVVSFAGPVGGQLFVSVDHGGGLVTSYSWLSIVAVRRGDAMIPGTILGLTGVGHPGLTITHLHFGARQDGVYIDPMSLLSAGSVVDLIRLAPIPAAGGT